MYSIYKLTFKDGKSYIGCTRCLLSKRMKEHRDLARHTKNSPGIKFYVHDAFLENNDDEIQREYLAMYECRNYALSQEIHFIVEHKTYYPYGYNDTRNLPKRIKDDNKRNGFEDTRKRDFLRANVEAYRDRINKARQEKRDNRKNVKLHS